MYLPVAGFFEDVTVLFDGTVRSLRDFNFGLLS